MNFRPMKNQRLKKTLSCLHLGCYYPNPQKNYPKWKERKTSDQVPHACNE